jgi:GH15 family glucan-1,4-alpha-glucosidase
MTNTADTPIEDYAFIGDLRTGALVARNGSIDWLCLPRFDSPSVFTALLGEPDDGHWCLGVVHGRVVGRDYLDDSWILRTRWEGPEGAATVIDFMPVGHDRSDVVRMVECTRGRVEVEQSLVMRFDYGKVVPWVRRVSQAEEEILHAVAGPVSLVVHGEVPQAGPGRRHSSRHELREGERQAWVLTAQEAWRELPGRIDVESALESTLAEWQEWADRIQARGEWAPQVRRSLLLLRALTHVDTGGIVAAPTASLPEDFGGERNWDYRYCWLRDSALTLEALLAHGFTHGARRWRDWLLRAVAGDPDDLLIMYGIGGERDLPERHLEHLRGYRDSKPVRIGNEAVEQYQADVVGEVMIALAQLRDGGEQEDEFSWSLQRAMLTFQEDRFDEPDHGIWEMRGEAHHFTHGRVMMWAAFDQGVRAVQEHGLPGPVERWRELRDRLHAEIWERGYDERTGSFLQVYNGQEVDASLLQLPQTGFIAYDDPAMLRTVARIEEDLVDDHGLVHRYRTQTGLDGLGGDEASFVICSFWLVEQYAHSGRVDDAVRLMRTLVDAANELGLLAEELDMEGGHHVGNYPQAFSHLGLVRAADAIAVATGELDRQEWRGRYGTAARCSAEVQPSRPAPTA